MSIPCYVNIQLDEYLDQQDALEAECEFEQKIIAERQEELKIQFSDMSTNDIAIYVDEHHGVVFDEWFQEHYDDDGVKEYFLYQDNQYYSIAIDQLLSCLDYSREINHTREY